MLKKTDITNLRHHINTAFRFKADTDWKYVFKEELFQGGDSCVTVFITCMDKPDVYSTNLNFSTRGMESEPRVWCFTKQELPLYIIMKFSGGQESSLRTNMNTTTLQNYRRVIDLGDTHVQPEVRTASDRPVPHLKVLQQKQIEKINKHMRVFDGLYVDALSNMVMLKKLTTNMRNYRYSHECPCAIDKEITRYERLYSAAFKRQKQQNHPS
jgi:hypothetical protein